MVANPTFPKENGVSDPACQQNASSKTEITQELQAIINAWQDLPEPLRQGILAMVRAAMR
ncbi:MAG: hypothetical protein NTY19_41955 [Planctomycetota bacterium]|nr:hypothetical protein [Planctomycetota bacterium]